MIVFRSGNKRGGPSVHGNWHKKIHNQKIHRRRRESAKAREARLRAQRQMRAIILMAVGLLFCALVFLPGEGIWNTAHKAMFGLLGIVAWGAALIPVYLAAVLSSDSRYTRFKVQAILLTLLAVLIAAAVQAGGGTVPESEKFTEMVAELYAQGAAMKGGGLIGSLLGVPLVNACGKVGALVILGLGIFICLMFLTGSTLVGLYSGMVEKPARKVSEAYSGAVDTLSQRMAEAEPRRPKFNIDVPMPTKPPVDPLAEEEDEEEPEPEQSGARNALTEAARRFFSPDTAAPQPARREVSATAEAFGDGSREEPAEEAIPAEPEVPEAAEAEAPAPEPQAVEPEPGEKELEVPAEPDHEYIDEIIRRMAQKQAAAGRRRKQPDRQRRQWCPSRRQSLPRPRRAWSLRHRQRSSPSAAMCSRLLRCSMSPSPGIRRWTASSSSRMPSVWWIPSRASASRPGSSTSAGVRQSPGMSFSPLPA